MRRTRIKYSLLVIFLTGCFEPYTPQIDDYEKSFLVIDGGITNGPGPYKIEVSKSFPLSVENPSSLAVNGLNLFIEEKGGMSEKLLEVVDGIYQTTKLKGEAGKSYRLRFDYEGAEYLSTWETILPAAYIDSLYYEVETRETTNNELITGAQFYLNSMGARTDATYYRFEWDETWQIGVFYPSLFDYVGNDNLINTQDPRHTCWKYDSQKELNVATTRGLAENILVKHPLGFITGYEERFIEKYSLLVKQYSLSEKEYLYWKTLKESNEELGSLYEKQPGNIKGNIFNVSNPKETILGYFFASGVAQKRVFVDDLQYLSVKSGCTLPLDTILKSDYGRGYDIKIFEELDKGKFFYDEISTPTSLEPLGVYLSQPLCSDCQLKGGDLKKPEYWDE